MGDKGTGWQKVFLVLFFLIILVVGFSSVLSDLFMPRVMKPAVYLYPQEPMVVSVNLTFDGELTQTDPPYGNGWEILAYPNGTLEGGYPYLFYEGTLNKIELPLRGWCVNQDNVAQWMRDTLPTLGLSTTETNDFVEYWLATLPSAEYYAIRLLTDASLNAHLKLDINPTPDTIIRVILIFSPISSPTRLVPPTIVTPQRTGFTLVEWGGILLASDLLL